MRPLSGVSLLVLYLTPQSSVLFPAVIHLFKKSVISVCPVVTVAIRQIFIELVLVQEVYKYFY